MNVTFVSSFFYIYENDYDANKTIDWRIVIVLSPLIIAAAWALVNIGAAALRQVQEVLDR